jgi:hypothetical protein
LHTPGFSSRQFGRPIYIYIATEPVRSVDEVVAYKTIERKSNYLSVPKDMYGALEQPFVGFGGLYRYRRQHFYGRVGNYGKIQVHE